MCSRYVANPDGSPVTKEFVKSGKYQIEVMDELHDADVYLRTPFDPENRRIDGFYEDEQSDRHRIGNRI